MQSVGGGPHQENYTHFSFVISSFYFNNFAFSGFGLKFDHFRFFTTLSSSFSFFISTFALLFLLKLLCSIFNIFTSFRELELRVRSFLSFRTLCWTLYLDELNFYFVCVMISVLIYSVQIH